MKRSTPLGIEWNPEESGEIALRRYLEFLSIPQTGARLVTRRVTTELAEDLRRAADALRSGRVAELSGEERERLARGVEAAAEGFAVVGAEGASPREVATGRRAFASLFLPW